MRRNFFCLFTAVGLLAQVVGCSEERGSKPESAVPQFVAPASAKPEAPKQSTPSTASVESQVSSSPAKVTQTTEEGRATPETQNAARRTAMERFQQMRKEPAPVRPQ